jgi:pimeloyl-ACP methyl ester carboxylesterase
MFFKLLTGLGSVIALLTTGGLLYRRGQQLRTAKMLAINTPNDIVEERFVHVGGIDQWVQIRGEDRNNPVMLVLHGGPGWSNSTFTLPLRSWEKHFTVVQWDHRGTGKTLRRNGKPGSGEMSFHCRVSDAIELTEFLHQYLSKDKVILLAESMGTLTGLPLAMLRPDMFSALVVTDLYVDMMHNEALKHELTLERVHSVGNIKGVTALKKIGSDPTDWDLNAWNVNMAWAFKTNTPTPNLDRALLLPLVLFSPIYSLRDVYTLLAGFKDSMTELFDEFRTFDARRLGTSFEVPFFLFQGECDVITLTSLAEEYFAEVEAPVKELSLIKNAGHFAAFTQPEQFLAALLKHVLPAVHAPGFDTIPSPSQPAKLNQR